MHVKQMPAPQRCNDSKAHWTLVATRGQPIADTICQANQQEGVDALIQAEADGQTPIRFILPSQSSASDA